MNDGLSKKFHSHDEWMTYYIVYTKMNRIMHQESYGSNDKANLLHFPVKLKCSHFGHSLSVIDYLNVSGNFDIGTTINYKLSPVHSYDSLWNWDKLRFQT